MSYIPSDAINQYTDANTESDQQAVGRSRAQGKRRYEESATSEHASEDPHASDSTWASTQQRNGVHSTSMRKRDGEDRLSTDAAMDIHDRTKRQRYLTYDEASMENFGPQPRLDTDSRSRSYSAPANITIGASTEPSSPQQYISPFASVYGAGDSESVRETIQEESSYTMINSLLRQLHYDRQSQRHPPDPS